MNTLLQWKEAAPISIEYNRNPFLGLHQEVDQAMREFCDLFSPCKLSIEEFENLDLMPSMDIVEENNKYTIQVELPGLDEKDIKISISDNTLTILGEKSTSVKNINKKYVFREITYGKYERVVSLPSYVDTGKAAASFKKGMLWVVIPKKAQARRAKRDIKVEQA